MKLEQLAYNLALCLYIYNPLLQLSDMLYALISRFIFVLVISSVVISGLAKKVYSYFFNRIIQMAGRKRCTKTKEHSSKKLKSEIKKNAELPMDLIVDILLRLPIKSLVTFSVTSRLMYSLIYHPYFMELHYNRARKNRGYLMKANNRGLRNRRVQKLNPLCFFRENEPTIKVFQPQEVGGGRHSIASSCDGLICLINFKEWDQPICIYNPATREHVQLPLPSPFSTVDAALVFDLESKGHKVFRLYPSEDNNPAEVRFEVFTLGQSTNTWRQKGVVPYYFVAMNKHVQASRAVNWLHGDIDMVQSVLSIDIISETWKVHPTPETDVSHQNVLIELHGHIAICGLTFDMEIIAIWILKDVADSTWEMVYQFSTPNWIFRANVETWVCSTSSLSYNKLLIWRGRNKLVFYDPQTETSKRVDTSPASTGWVDLLVIDHIESLVPCKNRWRPVQWPEINEILYDFCPVYGYPPVAPKPEIQQYEEGPDTELKL